MYVFHTISTILLWFNNPYSSWLNYVYFRWTHPRMSCDEDVTVSSRESGQGAASPYTALLTRQWGERKGHWVQCVVKADLSTVKWWHICLVHIKQIYVENNCSRNTNISALHLTKKYLHKYVILTGHVGKEY